MRIAPVLLSLLIVPACNAVVLDASAQAPPRQDCSAPEFRQFDFWLGSWNVTVQGKPAGTNVIESAMKGCTLIEHWTAAGGGQGTSLNFYDRRTKTWSQAWIDESGNALHLTGGVTDGRMILQSEPQTTPKGIVVQRITWSKDADQSVRQLWETSMDGGKTWSVAFDGKYVKS
jgi:hypothetical protein